MLRALRALPNRVLTHRVSHREPLLQRAFVCRLSSFSSDEEDLTQQQKLDRQGVHNRMADASLEFGKDFSAELGIPERDPLADHHVRALGAKKMDRDKYFETLNDNVNPTAHYKGMHSRLARNLQAKRRKRKEENENTRRYGLKSPDLKTRDIWDVVQFRMSKQRPIYDVMANWTGEGSAFTAMQLSHEQQQERSWNGPWEGFSMKVDANPDHGYTPLNMLASALAAECGQVFLHIIQKQKMKFHDVKCQVQMQLGPKLPKEVEKVTIRYGIEGINLNQSKVKKSCELATKKYSSIYATLVNCAEISIDVVIVEDLERYSEDELDLDLLRKDLLNS